MSFDDELHGECRHEIAALLVEIKELKEQRNRVRDAAENAGGLLEVIALEHGDWSDAVDAQQDEIRAALADEPTEGREQQSIDLAEKVITQQPITKPRESSST